MANWSRAADAAASVPRWVRWTAWGLGGAIFGITLMAVFAGLMRSYDHNESLYITAGWLVAHGQSLYADFSFWQMPYSAWLYAGIFGVFEPERFLFTGKFVSYGFWLGTLGVAGWWMYREFRDAAAAGAMLLVLALNPTLARCASEASNYIQPVFFSVLGYVLAVRGAAAGRGGAGCWFGAGVCAAMAVGFKLYYLPTAAAYVLVAVGFPGERPWRERVRKAVGPFMAGGLVGIAPAAWVAGSEPAAFWFNNYQVHQITTSWWRDVALQYGQAERVFGLPMTWAEKLHFAGETMAQPGNALLLVGGGLAVAILGRRRQLAVALGQPQILLAALLALTGLVACFLPTPMWAQYWGLPVPFVFLFFAAVMRPLFHERRRLGWAVLGSGLALLLAADGRLLARNARLAFRPEYWAPLAMAADARRLAELAPAGRPPETLLAQQQLWAVESGRFRPREELAYAPFTYVIADRIDPALRRRFHVWGWRELSSQLEARPPTVVVTGLYSSSFWADTDFSSWARSRGLSEREGPQGTRVFFVPPAGR
jgi:hypothetical protein